MKEKLMWIALMLGTSVEGMAQTELVITTAMESVNQSGVGVYDRVRTERKMEKGVWHLIVLPAALDGYYFGPDAPRAEVTAWSGDTTQEALQCQEMEDWEDFRAGHTYLVNPDVDIEYILHITPGVTTEVPSEMAGKEIVAMQVDEPKEFRGIASSRFSEGVHTVHDLSGRVATTLRTGQVYVIDGKKVRF